MPNKTRSHTTRPDKPGNLPIEPKDTLMKPDTTTKPAHVERIYARVERKKEVLERLKKNSLELSELSRRKAPLEYDLQQKKNAIRGFSENWLNSHPEDSAKKTHFENLVSEMKDDLDDINQQMEALEAERKRLKEVDLPGCIQDTEIAEVVAHQDAIKALRADAMRLQEAIAAQRQIISEAKASIVPVQDQSAQRAEILANIAIGEAGQKDLDELDSVAEGQRKTHEASRAKAEPIISKAAQTITGLEAKLAALGQKIEWYERETPLILEQYLMTEINRIGARYVSNAHAVKEDFLRLSVLESMLNRATGGNQSIIQFNLALPLPQLDDFRDQGWKDHPDLLFHTQYVGTSHETYKATLKAERERLSGAGLEIL